MIDNKYMLLKSKTVLYVEDDLVLQQSMLEIFNNFFKQVLVASNGDEAYDIFIENQKRIDMLITDINMPQTDGMVLSQYIRTSKKAFPIVIISAYTNTDYLLESINLNILAYIIKPFTTKKTLTLLDKLLDYFELNRYVPLGKGMVLDYENAVLVIGEQNIILTIRERTFLKLLAENRVVTFDMMYENMWDFSKIPTQDAIKSFIQKFKKKLPCEVFQNKRGEGYYLSMLQAD